MVAVAEGLNEEDGHGVWWGEGRDPFWLTALPALPPLHQPACLALGLLRGKDFL